MTLIEFLRARLDEEWEVARREGTDRLGARISSEAWERVAGEADSMLVSIFSPARVLSEVKAKRLLIKCYEAHSGWRKDEPDTRHLEALSTMHLAVALAALPYSGHEDYRPEWATDPL